MDYRIEGRLKKFNPQQFNLIDSRSTNRLKLRKDKIDTLIFNKRLKDSFIVNSDESQLNIDIKDLNIPVQLDFFFESSDDKQSLLLKLLQDNDKDIIKFALKKLSKSSCNLRQNEDNEIELDNDVFHMIIFYLCEDLDVKIKYEASFSLINITYASNSHVKKLIDIEVLSNLYNLTFHENLFIVNNVLLIFYNILTQEKEEVLDLIPLRKRIKEIFQSSKKIPDFLMTTIISIIKYTFIKDRDNDFNFEFANIYLPNVIHFFFDNINNKHESDLFWADSLNYIFYLTEVNEIGTFNLLQENNFFQLIFGTSVSYTNEELYLIYRIIGNLFFDDEIMDKLFNMYDVISFLDKEISQILNNDHNFDSLSKEMCFACSNIASGPLRFKLQLLQRGIVQKVLSLVQLDTKVQTIREIASFCCNLLEGASLELITELYNLHLLVYLSNWLNFKDTDTLKYCLKGIEILLDYGDKVREINNYGINFVKEEMENNGDQQTLVKLQYSNVKCIYDLVEDILHKYFKSDDIIEA